jgi:hypothetical protein
MRNRFRSHYRRDIEAGKLILCPQSSGWTDRTIAIAIAIVDWIAARAGDKSHCLLWDVFSAHRDEEVKLHARTQGTQLLRIKRFLRTKIIAKRMGIELFMGID